MNQTTISLPITQTTKKAAEKAATSFGFASLTEAIKIFIQNLAAGKTNVQPQEKNIMLSKKNDRRYTKIVRDIKAGKNVTKTENIDQLLRLLHA